MLYEAEFWVAIAFVLFLAVLAKFGVHRSTFSALDARRARIVSELEEARRLRDEAQSVLAQAQGKRRDAEQEASAIVASARAEAEQIATEAKAKAEELVTRRTKMAETKIEQAERQALADVRASAADAAVAAAEKILTAAAKGPVAESLLTRGIRELKGKL